MTASLSNAQQASKLDEEYYDVISKHPALPEMQLPYYRDEAVLAKRRNYVIQRYAYDIHSYAKDSNPAFEQICYLGELVVEAIKKDQHTNY